MALLYPKIIDLNSLKDTFITVLSDLLLLSLLLYSKRNLAFKEISLSLKLRQKEYCKGYCKENENQ